MNEQEFNEACDTIMNFFHKRGEDAANKERDAINKRLAPQKEYLHFQGGADGRYLTFILYDITTDPQKQLKTKTLGRMKLGGNHC
jgi:hypothetical protein